MELEKLFKLGTFFLVCAFAPFMYISFSVYLRCRAERPEFPYPMSDFTEFWKSLVSALCCMITKPLTRYMTANWCKMIAKDQDNPELLKGRVQKMTE